MKSIVVEQPNRLVTTEHTIRYPAKGEVRAKVS